MFCRSALRYTSQARVLCCRTPTAPAHGMSRQPRGAVNPNLAQLAHARLTQPRPRLLSVHVKKKPLSSSLTRVADDVIAQIAVADLSDRETFSHRLNGALQQILHNLLPKSQALGQVNDTTVKALMRTYRELRAVGAASLLNYNTVNMFIRVVRSGHGWEAVIQILSDFQSDGSYLNGYLMRRLLEALAHCDRPGLALRRFRAFRASPEWDNTSQAMQSDCICAVLFALRRTGKVQDAERVFEMFEELGTEPPAFAIHSMLSLYRYTGKVRRLETLLDNAARSNSLRAEHCATAMALFGAQQDIDKVFKYYELGVKVARKNLKNSKFPASPHQLRGSLLRSLYNAGHHSELLRTFEEFRSSGEQLTPHIYAPALDVHADAKNLQDLHRLLDLMKEDGVPVTHYVVGIVFRAYVLCGEFSKAISILLKNLHIGPLRDREALVGVALRVVLRGRGDNDPACVEDGQKLFEAVDSLRLGLINPLHANSILERCLILDMREDAFTWYNKMHERKLVNSFTYTLFMEACARRGDLEDMEQFHKRLLAGSKNSKAFAAVWRTYVCLMSAYTEARVPEKVESTLHRMLSHHMYPSETMVLDMLDMYLELNSLAGVRLLLQAYENQSIDISDETLAKLKETESALVQLVAREPEAQQDLKTRSGDVQHEFLS